MATSFHRIAYEALHICNGVRLADVLAALAPVSLTDQSRVIDIGTGNASVALALAGQRGVQVKAIEADANMADLARQRCQTDPCGSQVQILEARSGDVLDSLTPADLIIALGTTDAAGLGRVRPEATLTRLARCLNPAGHLLWGDLTYDGDPPGPIRTFVEATNLYTDDTGWRAAAQSAGLEVLSGARSESKVWDEYAAAMLAAVDDWLAGHTEDPDAASVRTTAERLRMMFDYGRPWLGFNLYLLQRPCT